jgi:hypothetical protein
VNVYRKKFFLRKTVAFPGEFVLFFFFISGVARRRQDGVTVKRRRNYACCQYAAGMICFNSIGK